MAVSARVSSSTAPTVAAATSRVGSGGRNIAPVSTPRVDAMNYSASVGTNDDSVHYDEYSHDSHGGGQDHHHHPGHNPDFVCALNRIANAHKITEYVAANDTFAPRLFVADMVRGVGIYESNMRVLAGTSRMLGLHFTLIY